MEETATNASTIRETTKKQLIEVEEANSKQQPSNKSNTAASSAAVL